MALLDSLAGVKVSLVLDHACNLRCRYCYNGLQFSRPMDWETARRAVDFGFERAGTGFLQLAFFGGEPMLQVGLMERVAEYARAEAARLGRTLRLSVCSNLTLLDDRRLRFLKLFEVQVQASVDGCRAAQDANRRFLNGRSSHPRAAANLQRLVASGVPTRVVSVVDPANTRFLVESLEALRDLGVRSLYFVPNLQAGWDDATREQLATALAALADRWARGLRDGDPLRLDPFHGKVLSHVGDGTRPPARCAFALREFAIAPSGRIYPCDRMVKRDDAQTQQLSLGDLASGLDEARREQLLSRRDHEEPECLECGLRHRCTHQCGCANQELTGDPNRVDPVLCWYERLVIAETDRVTNALFEERPEALQRFYS